MMPRLRFGFASGSGSAATSDGRRRRLGLRSGRFGRRRDLGLRPAAARCGRGCRAPPRRAGRLGDGRGRLGRGRLGGRRDLGLRAPPRGAASARRRRRPGSAGGCRRVLGHRRPRRPRRPPRRLPRRRRRCRPRRPSRRPRRRASGAACRRGVRGVASSAPVGCRPRSPPCRRCRRSRPRRRPRPPRLEVDVEILDLDVDGPVGDAVVGGRDAGAAAAPAPSPVARRARLGVAVRRPRRAVAATAACCGRRRRRGPVAAPAAGFFAGAPAPLAAAAAVLEVDALAEPALRLVDVGAPVDQRQHLLLGDRLRGEQRRDRLVPVGVVDAHACGARPGTGRRRRRRCG